MKYWKKNTMIREVCLRPAIEFVWCSFYLLCDCVYDKETNYFCRKDRTKISRYILSYRFWCHQTGRGLLEDHAHFEKLEWWISDESSFSNQEFKAEGRKWLEAAKDHQKEMDKASECMREENKIKTSIHK